MTLNLNNTLFYSFGQLIYVQNFTFPLWVIRYIMYIRLGLSQLGYKEIKNNNFHVNLSCIKHFASKNIKAILYPLKN